MESNSQINIDQKTFSLSRMLNNSSILLILQAFFVGFAFFLLYNVAYTLLVLEFGSSGLRIVYVLVGVTVPLITIAFNYLESKLHLGKTSIIVLFLLSMLFFISYFFLFKMNISWFPFVLMIINIMGSLYCMMLRGSQATEIYDARVIKKQYPRITGGEALAVVLGGLLVVPLSQIVGSLEGLLIIGAVSLLIALALVTKLVQQYIFPIEHVHHHHKHEDEAAEKKGIMPLLLILKKKYTIQIFSYQMLESMITLLIQYLVYSEAKDFFLTQESMSRFIGLIKAGITLASFLFLTLSAGKLLTKFGMSLGLAGSPIGVVTIVLVIIVFRFFSPEAGTVFFILLITLQFVDYIFYSGFVKTSVQSAFQPLPQKERDAVHTFAQGIGIPVSYGFAGILLILFSAIPGFTTVYAVYLTLFVSLLCGLVGILLYRSYSAQLSKVLSRRNISEMELSLDDASTFEIVKELLSSQDIWLVKSALEIIKNSAHSELYLDSIKELIESRTETELLCDLMNRLEALKPDWGKLSALKFLDEFDDPSVKASAIRLLCATVDDPVAHVAGYLEDDCSEIVKAAISGLFLYGGINGILKAGNIFNKLLESNKPDDRVYAGKILEETGIRNFYHPLLQLLQSDNEAVLIQALRAVKVLRHPLLLPEVLRFVEPVATRSDALAALAEYGDDIVPVLKSCIILNQGIPKSAALRIIRVASRISTKGVAAVLEESLEKTLDEDVASQIYATLSKRKYKALGKKRELVFRLINEITTKAGRILMVLYELKRSPYDVRALVFALEDYYKRNLEVVFTLCALLYKTEDIQGIEKKILLGSKKERALGSELLDVILEKAIKRNFILVIENSGEKIDPIQLKETFHFKEKDPLERIQEIISDVDIWTQEWIRRCAVYTAKLINPEQVTMEEVMFTIIERVIALKSADIFSAIPDPVLAHIASIAEDVEVSAKTTFIRKDEMGNCMYIIMRGSVSVHDEVTEFAVLGDTQVVGEMAVLDPEPRSAFVTAKEDTLLLKIEKEAFDSVMADHPSIANSVIHVLSQRLRKMMQMSKQK